MNKRLGQKIRKYREERGMSQFDLEMEIETSPGRISKIENDKINPDKETIIKIANALKLNTNEIASLFGIDLLNISPIFETVNDILLTDDISKIINKTVNDLIFKMGYIAAALFLIEEDKVYMRGLTLSSISEKAISCLPAPLETLYMSFNKANDNLVVRSIKENKVKLTSLTREYCSPLVDTSVADNIQKVTGDKSTIIYPLIVNDEKLGAIAFVKKVDSDFRKEREFLKVISNQIAISIYQATSNSPGVKYPNLTPETVSTG